MEISKLTTPAMWLIVGATRGIGLEFVKQILHRGDHVIATARHVDQAGDLYLIMQQSNLGALQLIQCDISRDASIDVGLMLSLRFFQCLTSTRASYKNSAVYNSLLKNWTT